MTGAQGSPYLQPDQWQFNFGWRYQYSDRHFTGSEEDEDRDHNNTQVKNTINMLTLGMSYGWSEQTQLNFTLPYFWNQRSQNNNAFPGERRYTHAAGIGDFLISAKHWMFDTKENLDHNLGLGFGIKLPTGAPNVQDSTKVLEDFDGDGNADDVRIRGQTVDQSIQPGDGGFGFLLDAEWFHRLGDFTPYAYAGWMFTPEGESGVQTGRSKESEDVMSIADTYVGRAGTMWSPESLSGLSFGLGGRIEGVAVHDPIGKDHGFRRPGFAISAEPSVILVHGRDVLSLSVPIAL